MRNRAHTIYHLHIIIDMFRISQVIAEMKQHCEDKLLRLYTDYIRTRAGKELGAGLHKSVQNFHQGVTSLEDILSKQSVNGA